MRRLGGGGSCLLYMDGLDSSLSLSEPRNACTCVLLKPPHLLILQAVLMITVFCYHVLYIFRIIKWKIWEHTEFPSALYLNEICCFEMPVKTVRFFRCHAFTYLHSQVVCLISVLSRITDCNKVVYAVLCCQTKEAHAIVEAPTFWRKSAHRWR
jgi:hypothetical protein